MKKKIFALVLALVMVLNLLPASVLALPSESASGGNGVSINKVSQLPIDLKQTDTGEAAYDFTEYEATEFVRVIVELDAPSMLELGYTKAQIASADDALCAKVADLQTAQNQLVRRIAAVSAKVDATQTVEVLYHYTTMLNAVSMRVPYGAVENIRSLDGVRRVALVPYYSVPEDQSGSTLSPSMFATKDTFGSAATWDVGYSGEGMRIAIIDTGLDLDHPSFVDVPKGASLTEKEIESVLTQLKAYERYREKNPTDLTASMLYVSEKIPFGFNYVDNDLDVTHDNDYQGDHGTHVAGIAAANKIAASEVVGVAPNAQVLVMKVFGKNGGAFFDDIIAALEDCFVLDVDAANLSLGSPAGFSSARDLTDYAELSEKVYGEINEHDIIVAIAAGNETSAANGNPLGTNKNLTSDPDNAIVASPATYPNATVVGSVENSKVALNYIQVGEEKFAYADYYGTFFSITGEQEYVMIPGLGAEEDFEGLDVEGKVAVISRGVLDFTTKQTNAMNAGAIGCIIYNNVNEGLMYMQSEATFPAAFVTMQSGETLANGADENGYGTLYISDYNEVMVIDSPLAGQMSDFSSWGVSPELTLLPDVTAPGGNIYSTLDGGLYGTMSGTSMATPHITGMAALVMQYLKDYYGFLEEDDAWYHTVTEALIMSTAEPIYESEGILYSPRLTGSGVANVYDAVRSNAYLTVNGSSPKVSFGDDDEKTGKYTFHFTIHNLSAAYRTFRLDGAAMTDRYTEISGLKFMGETARNLGAKFSFETTGEIAYDYDGDRLLTANDISALLADINAGKKIENREFDLNGDGLIDTADAQMLYETLTLYGEGKYVIVPSVDSVSITVTLELTDEDKAYMDENYENGIYVDGFVRCFAADGGVDLSLPFVGFYGDWSAAPVIDEKSWIHEDELFVNRYYSVLWSTPYSYTIGENPYIAEAYDPAHNVLSPNFDGNQDAISDIYLGLMRNAKRLTFTWTDENGNELYKTEADYIRKSYYSSSYGLCVPFIYNSYVGDYYTFLDDYGDPLFEELDRVYFTIDAYLDDGDEVVDDSYTFPFVLDTTAPVIDEESVRMVELAGGRRKLVFDVSDNYDIAAIVTVTMANGILDTIPVDTKNPKVDGESDVISIDVTGYDTDFYIAVCDYGLNESYYYVTFEGEQNIDADAFYGYRAYSYMETSYGYATVDYRSWVSFTDPSLLVRHSTDYTDDMTMVAAADYVDGYVIGVDEDGAIFAMKAGQYERSPLGDMSEYPRALAMAFDFKNKIMYVLTDEETADSGGYLLTLDILTGEIEELGILKGFAEGSQALTLACDNAGVLYAIESGTGVLCTIDPETLTATAVGATGYVPVDEYGNSYYQSMTVDHFTDTLYWMANQSTDGDNAFLQLDKRTGEIVKRSAIQDNSTFTAIFRPYTDATDVFPNDGEATSIVLAESELTLAAGTTYKLESYIEPYYVSAGDLFWESSDETVATVSAGVIETLSTGTTTITVRAASGLAATCDVTVFEVGAKLKLYDGGWDYQWLAFDAANPEKAQPVLNATQPEYDTDIFLAAAYANGALYAFDSGGTLYKLDPETLQGDRIGTNAAIGGYSATPLIALTYNYADGYFYGITQESVSYWESSYNLIRLNPYNVSYEVLGQFDANLGTVMNLAVDAEGNFYTVADVPMGRWGSIAALCTFTVESDIVEGIVFANPITEFYDAPSQYTFNSLTYSFGDECLYWADCEGHLRHIDPVTGEMLDLGIIAENDFTVQNVCLFDTPEKEPESELPEAQELRANDRILVLEGGTAFVGASVEPWNAKANLTYKTDDAKVATVDKNGKITAHAVGETVLTVVEQNSGLEKKITIRVVASAGSLYSVISDGSSYYWISFKDSDPTDFELLAIGNSEMMPVGGTYFDGLYYVFCQGGEEVAYKYFLATVDPAANYKMQVLSQVHGMIYDMTYDYTTGVLYAIYDDGGRTTSLAQVDTATGELYTLCRLPEHMVSLTADAKGDLYAVAATGNLYAVSADGAYRHLGTAPTQTSYISQSMTYDYNTGNYYWAYVSSTGDAMLYLVDVDCGGVTPLGSITSTQVTVGALFVPSDKQPETPATLKPTGICIEERQAVVAGETLELQATVLPVSTAKVEANVRWTSSDESIATVDQNGVVTAKKAGTAKITATVGGYEATCTVTVLKEARRFYAYDETNRQWISFAQNDTETLRVERADTDDEAMIAASVYTKDGKLFAYDENGVFYQIDPETFERTELGAGVSEMEYWIYDSFFDEYLEAPLFPVDLAYDLSNDRVYGVFVAFNYDAWVYEAILGEIDLENGEVDVLMTLTALPTNLTVRDGIVSFIDGFDNGVLYSADLRAEDPTAQGKVIISDGNYWGEYNGGRSLYEDMLTGTLYVIRDLGMDSTLYTITLGDADIRLVGTVGTEGIAVNSLFLK